MQQEDTKHHYVGYGTYILVWLALIALTSITVTVAGINFGMVALAIALLIAGIKSALVITIFMHIKYEDTVFKLFLVVSGFTILVMFVLTFVDVIYR